MNIVADKRKNFCASLILFTTFFLGTTTTPLAASAAQPSSFWASPLNDATLTSWVTGAQKSLVALNALTFLIYLHNIRKYWHLLSKKQRHEIILGDAKDLVRDVAAHIVLFPLLIKTVVSLIAGSSALAQGEGKQAMEHGTVAMQNLLLTAAVCYIGYYYYGEGKAAQQLEEQRTREKRAFQTITP